MFDNERQFNIPESMFQSFYLAMLDAADRLQTGTANLRRCINWMECEYGVKPPKASVDLRSLSDIEEGK